MENERYFVFQVMARETDRLNMDTLSELVEDLAGPCVTGHCICGIESMSGYAGTEEQCWKHILGDDY